MAGLFSGAGQDLAASEENLGKNLFNAGITVFDKLNDAEIVAQTEAGQQALSKQAADFDAQIEKDPDYSSYGDKNQKFQDQAWKLVEGSIKNQGAKNALHDWWNTQTIQRTKEMEVRSTDVRIRNALAQTKEAAGNYIRTGNKQGLIDLLDKQSATNLIAPALAEQEKAAGIHEIDLNQLFKKGHDVAFDPSGGEKSLDSGIDAIMSDRTPGITDDEKQGIVKELTQQHEEARKLAKEKTDDQNGKIMDKSISDILAGKLSLTGIKDVGLVGSDAGEKKEQLANFWENLHKDKASENPGVDFGSALQWISDPTKTNQAKLEYALSEFNAGGINKGQFVTINDKIASGITEAERAGVTTLHEGAKGTEANPALYTPEDELKAQNMLQEAISGKGKEASPQYVQEQAEKIKKLFADKAFSKALDDELIVSTKPFFQGGIWQGMGLAPKAGSPNKQDIAGVLNALKNGEFEGTYSTKETQSIFNANAAQVEKLVASKYKLNPDDLSVNYDQDNHMYFENSNGSMVRIVPDGTNLKVEIGKKAPDGTISWKSDGSL